MQACWLCSAAVTIKSAVAVLTVKSVLPGKLALSVRPLGSTAVTVIVQLATPGAVLGAGVHRPLFDKMSLGAPELTVMGASTLGSIGITMSGAVRVTVTVADWPTIMDRGETVTLSEVVSRRTASVPLISEML